MLSTFMNYPEKILEKVQKQYPALTDDFYNLGQIESVNIVAQSDEIYN